MRPTLHARWILPFVLLVAAWSLWRDAAGPRWRPIGPGAEFATLRGEPFCRRGSSAIAVVRFDPARARLRVRHYSRVADRPLDVTEWQHETQAAVVFNAGQFYPNWSYMGLLVSDGHAVSRRAHPGYQAALVAHRDGSGAHVVDLSAKTVTASDSATWGQVAQSFMLFEHGGGDRVRKSDRIANRTIVAEDAKGRVLVIVTEGGYTLADLAALLRRAPLSLTQAMSMDGGLEAELLVTSGSFHYASFGEWAPGQTSDAPGATTPLPAVVTLELP